MNQQELETYQAQLQQVQLNLKEDPENPGLQSLQEELQQLIALTEQVIAVSAASAPSNPTTKKGAAPTAALPVFTAGEECLARWSKDDKWYPARITSVGGSDEKRVYSVVFRGYQDTEVVAANAVKRLPPSQQQQLASSSSSTSLAGTKRKKQEEEDEKERKKRKNEKKLEVRAQKSAEQDTKKASWQRFAVKSAKKGTAVPGVAGTSIFKTPDNPLGRGEALVHLLSSW